MAAINENDNCERPGSQQCEGCAHRGNLLVRCDECAAHELQRLTRFFRRTHVHRKFALAEPYGDDGVVVATLDGTTLRRDEFESQPVARADTDDQLDALAQGHVCWCRLPQFIQTRYTRGPMAGVIVWRSACEGAPIAREVHDGQGNRGLRFFQDHVCDCARWLVSGLVVARTLAWDEMTEHTSDFFKYELAAELNWRRVRAIAHGEATNFDDPWVSVDRFGHNGVPVEAFNLRTIWCEPLIAGNYQRTMQTNARMLQSPCNDGIARVERNARERARAAALEASAAESLAAALDQVTIGLLGSGASKGDGPLAAGWLNTKLECSKCGDSFACCIDCAPKNFVDAGCAVTIIVERVELAMSLGFERRPVVRLTAVPDYCPLLPGVREADVKTWCLLMRLSNLPIGQRAFCAGVLAACDYQLQFHIVKSVFLCGSVAARRLCGRSGYRSGVARGSQAFECLASRGTANAALLIWGALCSLIGLARHDDVEAIEVEWCSAASPRGLWSEGPIRGTTKRMMANVAANYGAVDSTAAADRNEFDAATEDLATAVLRNDLLCIAREMQRLQRRFAVELHASHGQALIGMIGAGASKGDGPVAEVALTALVVLGFAVVSHWSFVADNERGYSVAANVDSALRRGEADHAAHVHIHTPYFGASEDVVARIRLGGRSEADFNIAQALYLDAGAAVRDVRAGVASAYDWACKGVGLCHEETHFEWAWRVTTSALTAFARVACWFALSVVVSAIVVTFRRPILSCLRVLPGMAWRGLCWLYSQDVVSLWTTAVAVGSQQLQRLQRSQLQPSSPAESLHAASVDGKVAVGSSSGGSKKGDGPAKKTWCPLGAVMVGGDRYPAACFATYGTAEWLSLADASCKNLDERPFRAPLCPDCKKGKHYRRECPYSADPESMIEEESVARCQQMMLRAGSGRVAESARNDDDDGDVSVTSSPASSAASAKTASDTKLAPGGDKKITAEPADAAAHMFAIPRHGTNFVTLCAIFALVTGLSIGLPNVAGSVGGWVAGRMSYGPAPFVWLASAAGEQAGWLAGHAAGWLAVSAAAYHDKDFFEVYHMHEKADLSSITDGFDFNHDPRSILLRSRDVVLSTASIRILDIVHTLQRPVDALLPAQYKAGVGVSRVARDRLLSALCLPWLFLFGATIFSAQYLVSAEFWTELSGGRAAGEVSSYERLEAIRTNMGMIAQGIESINLDRRLEARHFVRPVSVRFAQMWIEFVLLQLPPVFRPTTAASWSSTVTMATRSTSKSEAKRAGVLELAYQLG